MDTSRLEQALNEVVQAKKQLEQVQAGEFAGRMPHRMADDTHHHYQQQFLAIALEEVPKLLEWKRMVDEASKEAKRQYVTHECQGTL